MDDPVPQSDEARELHRIGDLIDDALHKPRLPVIERLPGAFMSGRWHRRSGDIYQRVAEVGSPNAGNIHHGSDDKAGPL
jgi:hypothetical protein